MLKYCNNRQHFFLWAFDYFAKHFVNNCNGIDIHYILYCVPGKARSQLFSPVNYLAQSIVQTSQLFSPVNCLAQSII